MSTLSELRCFNHANREAVARCVRCGRTFCRECITEHEGRLVCAACLTASASKAAGKWSIPRAIGSGAICILSFLFAWGFFYYTGKLLLKMPSSFHDSISRGF